MDFSKILKRSWKLTLTAKSLWWLGFFAVLTEAGLESATFYQLPAIPTNKDTAKAFTDSLSQQIISFFNLSNVGLLSIIIAIVTTLIIVVLYISYRSKAGLIIFADQSETSGVKKNESAKKFFKLGQKYAWKLFIFNILLSLIAALFVAIVLSPMIPFVSGANEIVPLILLAGLSIVAIAILVLFSVFLTIVKQFGERLIVLKNSSATQALSKSMKMAYKKISSSLLIWLVALAIQVSFTIASVIAFFVLGLLFFVIGALFYFLAGDLGAMTIGTIGSLAVVAAAVLVVSALTTFASYFWTLCFNRLTNES
ncbi:MAG: hypothetical protein BWY43_00394 [candidate division WS2 bacterium ADurb.Bin280]|uniref:Glycerophosphoryl diester phosphodiesterase membrane domain-containing protein n=1 Tax=candidate division WS2 bacterium ADurb.Bin280 TaxID=1852829 RepID=A0A1V5SDR0_9BACT|nr:MAG: hypothetical protein BWY43_00394 [candidate division WS2 bacterium ADurb.Bin280]